MCRSRNSSARNQAHKKQVKRTLRIHLHRLRCCKSYIKVAKTFNIQLFCEKLDIECFCGFYICISILNNADDNDLPSASLRNERDAPPFRAPCNTKLRASTFGTWKRSTLPVTMPSKCVRTRSGVTSRTSRS